MQTRHTFRKPDLLFILALVAAVGVFSSTLAQAEESLFSNVKLFRNLHLGDLLVDDIRMAGDKHSSLHLSSFSQSETARYSGLHQNSLANDTGAHLSWKISW